jgi:hypothetical protein
MTQQLLPTTYDNIEAIAASAFAKSRDCLTAIRMDVLHNIKPMERAAQLNKVDAELTEARAKREAITPEPATLPADLPALYRAHIDDLAATLSNEAVAGRASDELHQIPGTVVVSWNPAAKHHELELRGKLLELINKKTQTIRQGLSV